MPERQKTEEFASLYFNRAGIEETFSQGDTLDQAKDLGAAVVLLDRNVYGDILWDLKIWRVDKAPVEVVGIGVPVGDLPPENNLSRSYVEFKLAGLEDVVLRAVKDGAVTLVTLEVTADKAVPVDKVSGPH